ncbi:hypothetical protein Shyhy02_02830 [Streptomyces hygroscopicus subsp. hygroscopicus]|nr:hypothetical protein Shyhy02_02830 [Streptomyces hygroscopicus subsp. hygroscopicus]
MCLLRVPIVHYPSSLLRQAPEDRATAGLRSGGAKGEERGEWQQLSRGWARRGGKVREPSLV